MELPVKTIVALAFVLIVMLAFLSFFTQQSGAKLTEAEANRIFYDICSSYRESDCDWSVSYGQKYQDYMEACRVLFDNEAGRYSCLYRFCCEQTQDVLCSGLCHACAGNNEVNAKTECCTRYRSECPDKECSACA